MGKYKKLSYVVYNFDYHIVGIPKYRLWILKGVIKDLVDSDIRLLCEWKSCVVRALNPLYALENLLQTEKPAK